MNIKEVARLAGVSTATVSRTINGSDKVTPETAKRVKRAIDELKFYPNTNARALGSGKSSLYGLIISDITNPFFPELVKSFEDVAVQYGQEVLIANTDYDKHRMEHCVVRMLQRKVDGVAIMTSEMEDHLIDELRGRKIPLVFLDMGQVEMGISNVAVDYPAGIDAGVKYLRELGHEDIAFISGPMNLVPAQVRYKGFIKSMKRQGLTVDKSMIVEGNHRMDGGHEGMTKLLKNKRRPTAVMTSNDVTAIGAMGAIYEYGLKAPRDVSVIGFDDIAISAFTQPALTTVRLPRDEVARAAFRALYGSAQAAMEVGTEYRIEPKLVIRQSTGPVGG
jgi:DNA-binding LacI/PurR family transcriptional regulator